MLDPEYEARLVGVGSSSGSGSSASVSPYAFSRERSGSTARRGRTYGDRFIPTRTCKDLSSHFEQLSDAYRVGSGTPHAMNHNHSDSPGFTSTHNSTSPNTTNISNSSPRADKVSPAYSALLRSEVLGESRKKLFQFKIDNEEERSAERGGCTSPYSVSPMSRRSMELLKSPPKVPRKIPNSPIRVLEAPAIKDDFYLNLLDWSTLNVLAVGLGSSVYLWNATTCDVVCLCDLGASDSVTSVHWNSTGTHLAVGTNKGLVQQWDVSQKTKLRELSGHLSRVGAIAWRENLLTSGSRDRLIYNRDVRDALRTSSGEGLGGITGGSMSGGTQLSGGGIAHKLIGHRQEVCGLRWSPDGQYLASGGNDNKLLVWDINHSKPLHRYTDHTAAVKAIAWSPHQRGLLASGGGTADRCIRFWNTSTNRPLHCIDTGSQVCNIAWSKNVNELVSTHGYSQNQIMVWTYPTMSPVATLTGHATRVLYLSVSPDGQTIVTGAGDETLRFWNVFPSAKPQSTGTFGSSLLRKMEIR
jgi:cell division cycle 20-like protein 1 (cofactor of APC complex)